MQKTFFFQAILIGNSVGDFEFDHWRNSNNQENIKILKHQLYMIQFNEKNIL